MRHRFSGGRISPLKRLAMGLGGGLAPLLASTAPGAAAPVPMIPAPSVVRATPAMWEIRDADTTIYLFGTFHSLDQRTVWFDKKVRDAFDASNELMLETVVPADMTAAREQVVETSPVT